MDAKHQTLFATIAQITVTLLVAAFAGIVSYNVFLHERAETFKDKIRDAKVSISDQVKDIVQHWFSVYVPPDLEEAYRKRYSTKSEAERVLQLALDLTSNFALDPKAAREAGIDTADQHWRGRVYFSLLHQAANVITVGASNPGSYLRGVFPHEPLGPGFDNWKTDFNKAYTAVLIACHQRGRYRKDFEAELRKLAPLPDDLIKLSLSSEQAFLRTLDNIRAEVENIKRADRRVQRYDFGKRVHVLGIFVLFGIAGLVGIAAPLLSLARKNFRRKYRVAALWCVAAALLVTLLSFHWLWADITKPIDPDENTFVTRGWFAVMREDIERQTHDFTGGGMLDLKWFENALNSSDRAEFPQRVNKRMQAFIMHAKQYNDATISVNQQVLDQLRKYAALKPFIEKYDVATGDLVVYPSLFAEPERFSQLLKTLDGTRNVLIEGEVTIQTKRDVAEVKPALVAFERHVTSTPEAVAFRRAHTEAGAAMERLRAELDAYIAASLSSDPDARAPQKGSGPFINERVKIADECKLPS